MDKRIKILIISAVLVLAVIYFFIPTYFKYNSTEIDSNTWVEYACMTGQYIGKGGYITAGNGTHTRDMECCTWVKNEVYQSSGTGMTCGEWKFNKTHDLPPIEYIP